MFDPTDPEAQEPGFQERRGVVRTRMQRTESRLAFSGAERICRVRDLTPIGAGLEARDLPLPGQRVWLSLDGVAPAAAIVVWRDQDRCGLRLEAELVAREVSSVPAPRPPRAYRFLLARAGALGRMTGTSAAALAGFTALLSRLGSR